MKHKMSINLPNDALEIELDDSIAPKTVQSILDNLPISVKIHVWGQELYTDPTPVISDDENSRDAVSLMDVAYWPPGKAICLFFGPTPIGKKGEIKPYSAVNVIGKIVKGKFSKDVDGLNATFRIS